MENEIKLSKDEINSLFSSAEGAESLKGRLNSEQKQQLERVMADPEKIKAILASPEAKRLIQLLKSKRE